MPSFDGLKFLWLLSNKGLKHVPTAEGQPQLAVLRGSEKLFLQHNFN